MCGRYTLSQSEGLSRRFEISEVRIPPRFNIAPTQTAPVVRLRKEGQRELALLKWGLVPSWAREPTVGSRMINARCETVRKKPSFQEAFRRRRCLVPADGFFEWRKLQGTKQPFFFTTKDSQIFAFAGLWERFREADSFLETFTIITCNANELVGRVHSRMPVILPEENYSRWLNPNEMPWVLESMLQPFPPGKMTAFPVSRLVNSPANDVPACVVPLPENEPA